MQCSHNYCSILCEWCRCNHQTHSTCGFYHNGWSFHPCKTFFEQTKRFAASLWGLLKGIIKADLRKQSTKLISQNIKDWQNVRFEGRIFRGFYILQCACNDEGEGHGSEGCDDQHTPVSWRNWHQAGGRKGTSSPMIEVRQGGHWTWMSCMRDQWSDRSQQRGSARWQLRHEYLQPRLSLCLREPSTPSPLWVWHIQPLIYAGIKMCGFNK